jgi:hypothetical protein
MIIGVVGKKRSGKNTLGNYFTGRKLKELNLVEDYHINKEGKLVVKTNFLDGSVDWGILDLDRKDDEFINHASQTIWPYAKCYSFAEPLKDMIINLFDVDRSFVYGTEEQRNSKTHIKWQDMPGLIKKKDDFMSGIELMQFFGTEIMRKIYDPIWVNQTIRRILAEYSELSIITDVRFPNEVEAIKKVGGKIIKLTRDIVKSTHASEISLDHYKDYDIIIDNKNMTHEEYISRLDEIYIKATK